MQSIEIDRSKRLKEEPQKGHNRWHYDLTPVVEVEEGEEVVLETRDASDGQTTWASTIEDMATMDRGAVHPLTGPVYVKGAKPGDLLEIEYLDILPQPYGFTRFTPGAWLSQRPVRGDFPRSLGNQGRVGHFAPSARRSDTRWPLHGHRWRCAVGGTGQAMEPAGGRLGGPRRRSIPPQFRRRSPGRRSGGY